jgi:DNA adenine methylase
MNVKVKRLSALNYFGGKTRYLDFLLPLFPPHKNYVEPFCGSAVVFLNKKESPIETISDVDGRLINFFRVLRDHPKELIKRLQLTLYSRSEFQEALPVSEDPIEDARRYFVRSQQSFGGQSAGNRRINSWRTQMSETRRGISLDVSKFLTKVDGLSETVSRFKMAQIENRDCFYIIPKFDRVDTFYFCDPPYMHDTRTGKNDYQYEFTLEQQEELAKLLNGVKGLVMLCGYDNPKYREWYAEPKWKMILGPDRASNLGKNHDKSKRECVWVNYNPSGNYQLWQ